MATRARKTAKRRPVAVKAKRKSTATLSPNAKAHLKTYKDLESKLNTAWDKLSKCVKMKNRNEMQEARNEFLLLLGECDYMIHAYERCIESQKKTK